MDAAQPLLIHRHELEEAATSTFSRSLNYIYFGHFLARWGAGMWDFFVALFLITIMPNSLAATASYGLIEAMGIAAFGVCIGNWVDKYPDLKVLRLSLVFRNGSIIVATLLMLALLLLPVAASAVPFYVALVSFSGALGALAGLGSNILLERDWVVSISEKNSDLLVQMNTVMRRIDLACKLLAPVFVGGLMSIINVLACVILISIWNLVTLGIEYWLLSSAHSSLPQLNSGKTQDIEEITRPEKPRRSCLEGASLLEGFTAYLRQECVLAGVALALLYFTVLSFGSLMTATLEWRGVPPYIIGLARGLSACVGVGATFMYPKMYHFIREVRTGLWSIWMQWSCLLLCVASVWVPVPLLSSTMLITGVVISRLGLWMFDLSITQLMQSSVPEPDRGVVGGVQNSLQSLMNMMTYIMAIVVSHPQDFWMLVVLSFSAVTAAAFLYSSYTYKVRGHLFHPEKISQCFLRADMNF